MADSFDKTLAAQRHQEIIREAERIRDSLTRDVIDYYYNSPLSEDEEKIQREGMRKYLKIASDNIYTLMNGKL
ncbi:MAG: hypothetical protein P4L74_01955 [Candidatus Doudnabacteria bacterium]|nr:hypothetical protein [Candidatus Doudnabacteria bacterium]